MNKNFILLMALFTPGIAKADWYHFSLIEIADKVPVLALSGLSSSEEERNRKCREEAKLHSLIREGGGEPRWETMCGYTNAEFDFDFGGVLNGPILIIYFEPNGEVVISKAKDMDSCEAGAERTNQVTPETEVWCAQSLYVLQEDSYGSIITYDNEFE